MQRMRGLLKIAAHFSCLVNRSVVSDRRLKRLCDSTRLGTGCLGAGKIAEGGVNSCHLSHMVAGLRGRWELCDAS